LKNGIQLDTRGWKDWYIKTYLSYIKGNRSNSVSRAVAFCLQERVRLIGGALCVNLQERASENGTPVRSML